MAITATKIAGAGSSTAVTTATFPAQAAGTWLVLQVSSDDYRLTTGTNRPESSGWTNRTAGQDELGSYVWTKLATGSETSVTYAIGSGVSSAWEVIAVTGATDTLDNTPVATHTHGGSTTASGAVTPSAGNRYVLALCGAYHSNTNMSSANWSNSYATVGFQAGPSTGSRENVAAAGLATSAGASTSTTATWVGAAQLCSYGTAIVFREAAAGTPPGQGGGSGSWSFAGAGSGKRTPRASGSGTVGYAGSGAGSTSRRGSGSGAFSFSGSGIGSTVRRGSGSGTVSLAGSGSGQSVRRSTGSGTLAWAGSGSGSAPVVDSAGGSGSGVVAYVGAGSGKRSPKAIGTGAVAFAGAGSGAAPDVDQQGGSGVGSWAFTGSGAGKRTPIGSGSGAVTFAGVGVGVTQRGGAGSGSWSFAGAGLGVDPSSFEDITVAASLAPRRTQASLAPRRTTAALAARRTTATLEDR